METPPHLSFDLRRSNWFFRVKYLFGINGYISVDGWYKKCKFDLLQTNRTVKNWEDSTWLTRGQHWKYFNTLPSLMLLFSAVGDLGKKSAKLSNVKGISSLLLFFFFSPCPCWELSKTEGDLAQTQKWCISCCSWVTTTIFLKTSRQRLQECSTNTCWTDFVHTLQKSLGITHNGHCINFSQNF